MKQQQGKIPKNLKRRSTEHAHYTKSARGNNMSKGTIRRTIRLVRRIPITRTINYNIYTYTQHGPGGATRWDELKESAALLIDLACCFDRPETKGITLRSSWRL
jgi:hypothetical protein